MKDTEYIIISGFDICDNNRGTAALGYGSVAFLQKKGLFDDNYKLLSFRVYNNPLKKANRNTISSIRTLKLGDKEIEHVEMNVNIIEYNLLYKFGKVLPFTSFGKAIKKTRLVAAINGGDGFSDIYSTPTFLSRLKDTELALKYHIPVIQLPQTIGPFNEKNNYDIAKRILKSSEMIFVRDEKFVDELNKLGLRYELTNDLSYFMQPEPFDISIKEKAIGLNISGLAYSNKFRTLSGEFDNYPYLIDKIIKYFQTNTDYTIYLISHSYNYNKPEYANDDLLAAKDVYNNLENKRNVELIDLDLNSPQTKYLISRMKFFIGTRMHANFAAIFTNVPVFGLAYSYKFEGAFNHNGIYNQTAMITNISESQADSIVNKIADISNRYLNFC